MKYLEQIRAASGNPQQIEALYQAARRHGEAEAFTADLQACYAESPTNLLYEAWYYRLAAPSVGGQVGRRGSSWPWAIPLSVLLGLVFWLLSDAKLQLFGYLPYLLFFWAPLAAFFVLAFLVLVSRKGVVRTIAAAAGLLVVAGYVVLSIVLHGQGGWQPYLDLGAIHVILLSWIAVGIGVLGLRSTPRERFAFISKSLEVAVTAGIYLAAGGVFGALTYILFGALGIYLSDAVLRMIFAGGAGLIPVLAVATVYDPQRGPGEQDFGRGLGKIITTVLRLVLPLTLLVLVIYICVIPFFFTQPFFNRDVLVVYNAMLFAIVGLLIGVVPVQVEDLPLRLQNVLRIGILVLAALVVLVSLYALAAIVYRTVQDGITMNRLTVIGWNGLNIGLLVYLLFRQVRYGRAAWVESLHRVFSVGAVAYAAWGLFLILAIPWVF
jgi:hypothetical protein